jgi:prephenate dehydratase
MTAKPKISYQGEPGANSHIACIEAYPDHEPLPCRTFEDAFQAVKEGEAALAMIPIDNSVAGRVADIHHIMPQSNLHIIGEHFLRVHHQLVAGKGTAIGGLKSVHSHVHALGQCRKLIRELGLTPVVAVDTAGAARELRDAPDATRAVLSTALAAEIYGLEILRRDVEDEEHNTTRFVILSREQKEADASGEAVVTSFIFRVRNVPAALYKAMGGFATNGVNMTKLESYQLGGQFSATQFYVRILGVYPASPHRQEIARRMAGE